MNNLAGHPKATERVTRELERLQIKVVPVDPGLAEVSSRVAGLLHDFTFERAWSYYGVKGRMPLAIATKMYEHPIWRSDVRAGGCAGAGPPIKHATCYCRETGKKTIPQSEWDKCEGWLADKDEDSALRKVAREILESYVADPDDDHKNPEKYDAFVEDFHVDSEAGMLLLVQTICKYAEDAATS